MLRQMISALCFAALVAAPVTAKDQGPYYRAELAQPAGKQVIAGGVLWLCEGTQCVADKSTSRPVVLCKRLAAETSTVTSFTYGGESLAAEDLARCNA